MTDNTRTRWLIAVAIVASLIVSGCMGLGIGFIVGNIYGQDAVCEQVWKHPNIDVHDIEHDIPICLP